MSSPTEPTALPPDASQGRSFSPIGLGLLGITVILVVTWLVVTRQTPDTPNRTPVDSSDLLQAYRKNFPAVLQLDAAYADADGDLVADAPKDGKFVNPDKLAFSVVGDPEKNKGVWKDFADHLKAVTGKEVEYTEAGGTLARQLGDLKGGKLHVTAFSTGAVLDAVNKAGFVPLFCPADRSGKFGYKMLVIAPPSSNLGSVEALKGRTIALVGMSSNSGFRAPVALLAEKGLILGRDYQAELTGDHKFSIKGVVDGKYEAAAVASDLLKTGADGKPEGVKVVYESKTFPPLCFGVPHNLDPALASKVREAFTSFNAKWDGSSVGKVYTERGQVQFAPVKYKEDFESVREVDVKLHEKVGKS